MCWEAAGEVCLPLLPPFNVPLNSRNVIGVVAVLPNMID
jgi:hypothetical protein